MIALNWTNDGANDHIIAIASGQLDDVAGVADELKRSITDW